MATLSQLSQIDNQRGREALGYILQYSPLLRFYEEQSAFAEGGTTFDSMPVDADGTVQTRVLGGSYTSNDLGLPTRIPQALGFHGDQLDIDRSIVADAERGLRSVEAYINKFFPLKVKYWVEGMERLVMNGTGVKDNSGREMKGLSVILDGQTDLPGFTGHTGVIDAVDFLSTSPNAFDLTDEANWDDFMEGMEQLMYMVGATGILLNRQLGSKMTTIARKNHIQGERRDAFGNPIDQYDAADLVRLNDGSITNTESDNASTPNDVTTSLYLVRPAEGEQDIVTNSGLEFEDYDGQKVQEKQSTRMTWEMRCENNITDKWSILRVRNIKVPSGTESLFA